MRILVCGGRNFNDEAYLTAVLNTYNLTSDDLIIHGDAKGADRLAGKYAEERGINVLSYPARWHIYGKSAGMVRNRHMLQDGKPDLVIAFPGGKGTAGMVQIAEKAGVPIVNFGRMSDGRASDCKSPA